MAKYVDFFKYFLRIFDSKYVDIFNKRLEGVSEAKYLDFFKKFWGHF